MSRRKQLHPKPTKGENEMRFVLPAELKYDEKTNTIITGVNLVADHRFGPFPADLQIEDRIGEAFYLLDIKDNWLAYCSELNQLSANLYLIFQNKQLIVIVKESIPIGTRLYSNQIIIPKLNMSQEIQIKEEPIETEIRKSSSAVGFLCDTCGIRFSNRNTLDAHREHYCIKHDARISHSTESTIITGVKRKSTDYFLTTPTKRISKESYSSERDNNSLPKSDQFIRHQFDYCERDSNSCKNDNQTIPFTHPIQIGQFIYVPIPIVSSQIENKPLDLSKKSTKRNLSDENQKKLLQEKLYQCEFCSIHFCSFKTLQAHQENYCIEYQKQKSNEIIHSSSLFPCRSEKDLFFETNQTNSFLPKCTICLAMFDNEETLFNHIKCVHTNVRLIECLECRSRFRSKWNLIRHMKLLHTNIKCDEEENIRKSFNSINLINRKYSYQTRFNPLTQHMNKSCLSKLRTNDITYCSTCNISFQHRTSYEAHKMYYCRDGRKMKMRILT